MLLLSAALIIARAFFLFVPAGGDVAIVVLLALKRALNPLTQFAEHVRDRVF